jgi:hypothetical protein
LRILISMLKITFTIFFILQKLGCTLWLLEKLQLMLQKKKKFTIESHINWLTTYTHLYTNNIAWFNIVQFLIMNKVLITW